MFTAYHAIMLAVLLIGGAVFIQASWGYDSLVNNPIPVKATGSKFDSNTY